jgi:hypothetical protein
MTDLGSLNPPTDTGRRRRNGEAEHDPEARALVPWFKRFCEFCGNVKLIAAAIVLTAPTHAWIRSIPTTDNIDEKIGTAVTKAMAVTNGRLETIETNTAKLPEWKGEIQNRITKDEIAFATLDGRVTALPLWSSYIQGHTNTRPQ